MKKVYKNELQKVMSNIKVNENGCWIWQLGISTGYAECHLEGSTRQVHRWLYQKLIGVIPKGKVLDHICHNKDKTCKGGDLCIHRRCINPCHLELTTRGENVLRGKGISANYKRRKVCIRGHPYTPDNLIPNKKKMRRCKQCAYAENKRWRDKQKGGVYL